MPLETRTHELTAADRGWFGEQVEALLPDLFGTAVRLCGNRADAEDLVALAVSKAWAGLPSLEDRDAFCGWIFRILNNAFVSDCRSARAQATRESIDAAPEQSFSLFERLHQPFLLWQGEPEIDVLNRLLAEDIERAIAGLPPEFRSVVVMVDVEGLAYREVAETLGIPVGTVRSRLARGRSRLQRALWDHAVEAGLRNGRPGGASRAARDDDGRGSPGHASRDDEGGEGGDEADDAP